MKLIKKTLHFLVFICFACFAYVQYNDSDASLWIIIYGFVAIIALGSMLNFRMRKPALLILIIMLILIFCNLNLLTSWANAGYPSFIDYEKTDVQVVENIREFLGLTLSALVLSVYASIR